MITSKSIYKSNIAFVFKPSALSMADNFLFAGLYQGENSIGSRFVDDPTMRLKILVVPRLNLTFTLEGDRLRVDEENTEPSDSKLIAEGLRAINELFPKAELESIGFNFDIYYKFSDVVPMNYLFESFIDKKTLDKKDLRNLGIQFTLEKDAGKKSETYFIKITAPLEIAVHANYHYNQKNLENKENIQKLFEKDYTEIDEVINNLKF